MENCSTQPQPAIRLPGPASRPTNENNINITVPITPTSQSCDNTSKSFTIEPQPLKLSIDTSTDWPAIGATSFVGFASALVALAVGFMAYIGQRNQVRAARANFRHGWQQEIKQLVAKFIAVTARIHYEMDSNPDYLNSSESNEEFTQLIETHARIELMLERPKDYTKEISRLTTQMIKAVKSHQLDQLNQLSNDLLEVANGVVEKTWQDIQNDLEGKYKK